MYRTKQQKRVIYHFMNNFQPFPTIKEHEVLKEPVKVKHQAKTVKTEKPIEPTTSTINLPRIIYAAAQNLLRHYPMNLPVLIYQFHSNITHTGFDVFMEKTEKGWKEWVNMYPVHTEIADDFYLMDGLALAIQQELEMTELLPSLMSQSDWLHRLMD
jgi:hypothetical protein